MKIIFSLIVLLSILITPQNVYAENLILGGGCFWCMEHDLESVVGINSVVSGYAGGTLNDPTYENHNGHQEVVLIDYDPKIIELKDILRRYLRNIDPLDGNGQFCDRGDSYRPVIFFEDRYEEDESRSALKSASHELDVQSDEIKVELKVKDKFWMAEDYHQDFAINNELKYKFYRFSCGRDKRLDQLWGVKARTDQPWT